MNNKSIHSIILGLIILICLHGIAIGYDDKITHPDITKRAAETSNLNNYLMENLGFDDGLKTQFTFNNQKLDIKQWLRKGSTAEDDPNCRASNHFHDPTKLWNQSYMTDQPWWLDIACLDWKPWYSNITWATGYLSPAPNGSKASFNTHPDLAPINWDKAREYYYNALTSTLKESRETYFALTFKAVGQVVHLLEDVSVPAHTRNDFTSHLTFNGINSLDPTKWFGNPFEHYVKINPNLVTSAQPIFPSFTNLRLTDFWDTNQFNDNNPPNSTSIGLAEYSNGNFLSNTTIFKGTDEPIHSFPYPTWSKVVEYDEIINGEVRTYIKEIDGEPLHLAAGMWFYKYIPSYLDSLKKSALKLDEKCHEDYASLLIPRAVGYSAGLLNYFFRGSIEITPPAQVAYAVTDGSQTPYVDNYGNYHQQFTSIKAKVRNSTPDTIPGEEVQNCNQLQENCVLQAVARYKIIPNYQNNLSNYPPDGATMQNTEYTYSVSVPKYIDSLSSTIPQEFTFYFTTDPIPAGITDLHLFIVFKGTLGNETDIAIAVGMKDLMEPTHQVLWNLTDMFSLYGHLYTAQQIRDDPDLLSFAGGAHIDPYPMTFGIGYLSAPPGPVNPFTYSAITVVQPSRHIRLVVLVDKPQNNYMVLVVSDAISGTSYFYFASPGVINQEENGVWQTPTPITTFRYGLDGITQIPIRQHFSYGVLRCYPMGGIDAYGNPVCSYPESEAIPADELSPSPIDAVYFYQAVLFNELTTYGVSVNDATGQGGAVVVK